MLRRSDPSLACDRQANFAVSPIPNISFGFQLSGTDQNCQPRVKFVGRDSYSALFERLLGLSDNSCDLQPTHVAERQKQLIDLPVWNHSAASIRFRRRPPVLSVPRASTGLRNCPV